MDGRISSAGTNFGVRIVRKTVCLCAEGPCPPSAIQLPTLSSAEKDTVQLESVWGSLFGKSEVSV